MDPRIPYDFLTHIAVMESGRTGLAMPMGSLYRFKKDLKCTEVPELKTECELVWVSLFINETQSDYPCLELNLLKTFIMHSIWHLRISVCM